MQRLLDAFRYFFMALQGKQLVEPQELPAQPTAPAKPPEPAEPRAAESFSNGAIYALLLLQRSGRLIDFLQESIDGYADDQIGAAVRQIHRDCQKVFSENLQIKPIIEQAEGATAEFEGKLDPTEIQLSGTVPDAPPYKGTVRHRGWQIGRVHFPTRTGSVNPRVVQPAEVEIN